jgi:phosphocarrier protein
MKSRKVIVANKAGIHCRPASRIMQKALEFSDCELSLKSTKGEADLSSILGLLSIGLERGDEIEISASGSDEDKALHELSELFTFEFDFPPRV